MKKHFEFKHGTVTYTVEKDANGQDRPKLYIQIIDDYRYQRELSVQLRHEPGDMKSLFWEIHAYKHAGIRQISRPTEKNAKAFIARILELAEKYPSLLFNERGERPSFEGFVHMHDHLLDGYVVNNDFIKSL